jgi:mannose-6-phosphate isomerase-like protein (cupin superfamily)
LSNTTLLRTLKEMKQSRVREPRGGKGEISIVEAISPEPGSGRQLRLIHDVTLPAGAVIGTHSHESDAEYYYFLSGRGRMTLDGKVHEVCPGDVSVVFPGGSHGLANESDSELRMIAISIPGEEPGSSVSGKTFLRLADERPPEPTHRCHGGVGTIQVRKVINREADVTRLLRIMHDDVIPVGTTIGVHEHGHENDEEYYYILSGGGVMVLDGERHEVGAGDIGCVFPGGSHGFECSPEQDTRMFVVGVFRE